MRSRWIYVDGEAIPAEEYAATPDAGYYVMPDIQPYKSMVTGEMIGSRSTHRAHLRQHNVTEVGNEKFPTRKVAPPGGLKQRIIDVVNSKT